MSVSSEILKYIWIPNGGTEYEIPETFSVDVDIYGNARNFKLLYLDVEGEETEVPVYGGSGAPDAWNAVDTYSVDEIVEHDGLWYICLQENTNQEPAGDNEYWQEIGNYYVVTGRVIQTTSILEHGNGETLTIIRDERFTQNNRYPTGLAISNHILEGSLDKLTRISLQLKEVFKRAVVQPASEAEESLLQFPPAAKRADCYLAFDSNGDIEMQDGAYPKNWNSYFNYGTEEICQHHGEMWISTIADNQGNEPGVDAGWDQYRLARVNGTVLSKSADYTIPDAGCDVVEVEPGAINTTITLPPLADNIGRELKVNRGAGAGEVIVDGEGDETINGKPTVKLLSQNESAVFFGGTSEWKMSKLNERNGEGYLYPKKLDTIDLSAASANEEIDLEQFSSGGSNEKEVGYTVTAGAKDGDGTHLAYFALASGGKFYNNHFPDGISPGDGTSAFAFTIDGTGGLTLRLLPNKIDWWIETDGCFDKVVKNSNAEKLYKYTDKRMIQAYSQFPFSSSPATWTYVKEFADDNLVFSKNNRFSASYHVLIADPASGTIKTSALIYVRNVESSVNVSSGNVDLRAEGEWPD